MNIMTDEAYVEARGCECPMCGSDELTGHEWTASGGAATQEITCDNCHASWYDYYELAGFVNPTCRGRPACDT